MVKEQIIISIQTTLKGTFNFKFPEDCYTCMKLKKLIVPLEVVLLCSLTSIQVEHCNEDKQENLIKETASQYTIMIIYCVSQCLSFIFVMVGYCKHSLYYILCTMYTVH